MPQAVTHFLVQTAFTISKSVESYCMKVKIGHQDPYDRRVMVLNALINFISEFLTH
jgi:hypothetical protein